MGKSIDLLLVERLDGSPAVVTAPYCTGSEGDMVIFGDTEDHIGQVVLRTYAQEDSTTMQILSSFTTIYPTKQMFRHCYTSEDADEELPCAKTTNILEV